MKKIITSVLFMMAIGLTASAQEASTAVAATAAPAKASCCVADAKKATADVKTSCHTETATAAVQASNTTAANSDAQPVVVTPATDKKACKTSGSCCGEAKAEAKKVL
ncbi:MAG: hypothetical protein EOO45_11330 [Flavobacterium sp.]|nr:MAG: hypothetical protein EOO45_11330 [Flavobacterium sp.]